jgi:ATP/maltotriose-dependent transcriptional regulator MalT
VTTLDWLARTKLIPPSLRGDVIARPRLLAALAQALADHPLTLLSAPAGSGKTTLLSSLLASLSTSTGHGVSGTGLSGSEQQGGPVPGPLSPRWPGSLSTRRTTTRPASSPA